MASLGSLSGVPSTLDNVLAFLPSDSALLSSLPHAPSRLLISLAAAWSVTLLQLGACFCRNHFSNAVSKRADTFMVKLWAPADK